MNRKILIQAAAPAAIIGGLLCAVCLVSAWYINRLQAEMSQALSRNVTSMEAAQDLENTAYRLRFNYFQYLDEPSPDRLELIKQNCASFEQTLALARRQADTPEEGQLSSDIETGYRNYRTEMEKLFALFQSDDPRTDLRVIADRQMIRLVTEPCERLSRINKDMMTASTRENEELTDRIRLGLLLLGLGGPIGGIIGGYGVARGFSRTIHQLSVRVQGITQRLDEKVASVRIVTDGDPDQLDQQLQRVVQQVEAVAERLQKQQQSMLRAQQLSAVGQLAASVAHEIRNPLTAVKLLVEAALRSNNRKPLTSEDLWVIHGEIDRLEQRVHNFLNFARLPTPRRTPCDVRDVVIQAVNLVKARASQQGVQVDIRQPMHRVAGHLDCGQMCTVLVNLFMNSLDAMPAGGRLTVHLRQSDSGSVALTVRDTGSGIPAEMNGRLFTPFATTKPTGTGLGLSISQRIVEEHSGRIIGDSNPTGAAFTIYLPATPQEEDHHADLASH
jgi:signal transduction histidine kinase